MFNNGALVSIFFWFRLWSRSLSSNEGATEQQKNIVRDGSHNRRNVLMYEAQYSGGSYIGVSEEGEHYTEVVAFMINGLNETVPI